MRAFSIVGCQLLMAFLSVSAFAQKEMLSSFGGAFTPKGEMRILVVFASFKDKPTSNSDFENEKCSVRSWSKNPNGLPDFVDSATGEFPELAYSKIEDFETYRNNSDVRGLSKYYEEMSLGKFHLLAGTFRDSLNKPVCVQIDAASCKSWADANARVLKEMQKINPHFDLRPYDNRKNTPNFLFDNSTTEPDGLADYVIIVHRYNNAWNNKFVPVNGMARWVGSGGGYAALSGAENVPAFSNGIKITSEGFTMALGNDCLNIPLYVHEIAHRLYNCPHFFGVNGVSGQYFHVPCTGWSATQPHIFLTMNAWERWYAGMIEILAEVKESDSTQVFVLRDFARTGDALRIDIPFSSGQSLWLENHQIISDLDHHAWYNGTPDADAPIANATKGIYMMVEDVCKSRKEIVTALGAKTAGGLRIIPGDGQNDYSKSDTVVTNNWGNRLNTFKRGRENSLSGMSPLIFFRSDENGDGVIRIDEGTNSAANEGIGMMIAREEWNGRAYNMYRSFGSRREVFKNYARGFSFAEGAIIGMGSNPMIVNMPRYIQKDTAMFPFFLNGLELKINYTPIGDAIVSIKYKQTRLLQNTRWTGRIILPNISRDTLPDLIVQSKMEILFDKSGMPNRHIRTVDKDFVTPTTFTVVQGATLKLEKKAKMKFEDGSTLILEKGSTIILDEKSSISFDKKSHFIDKGATIIRGRKSKF